jgi:transposase
MKTEKKYPSDISLEQFELIRGMLEGARKKTKPRKVDLYEVFKGICYILKSGCQWRMLPSEYPKWRTVHEYFLIWSKPDPKTKESLLEAVLKKNSWRGPTKTGAQIQDEFLDRRRTECEKH